MSSSMFSKASLYGPSKLANSVYCCQKSVSSISAAARNRRMAASPLVMEPNREFPSSWSPKATLMGSKEAPPITRFFMNDRRGNRPASVTSTVRATCLSLNELIFVFVRLFSVLLFSVGEHTVLICEKYDREKRFPRNLTRSIEHPLDTGKA